MRLRTKNSEARHPLREPGSASQHPECNGPAPHYHCDLFDQREWSFQVRDILMTSTSFQVPYIQETLWALTDKTS